MDHPFVIDTVSRLLHHLSITPTGVTVAPGEGYTRVNISSEQSSRIIGWHGETLNALQHIVKAMVRQKYGRDEAFLILDVDGYRLAQEDRVKKIAEQKADFVRRTGNRLALAPMSPYFRRVVHLHVANSPALQDLTTESIGEGDYRQVVLRLREKNAHRKSEDDELAPILAADDGLENLDV